MGGAGVWRFNFCSVYRRYSTKHHHKVDSSVVDTDHLPLLSSQDAQDRFVAKKNNSLVNVTVRTLVSTASAEGFRKTWLTLI